MKKSNLLGLAYATVFVVSGFAAEYSWETRETIGEPYPRHEAAFLEFEDKFYLLGGRRIQPVSIYDPKTNTWSEGTPPPVEIHHFQPVSLGDRIHLLGAMTGPYPNEEGLDRVLTYLPREDRWEFTHEIPKNRRRGGAGAVAYSGKIYMSCGIIFGHVGGYVNWFDEYDPKTGEWKTLPNAPHKRDHFQSAILDGKMYCAGGRTTSKESNQVFDLTVPEVDVYDFKTGKWSVLRDPLPTPRAGNSTMSLGKEIVVVGGESIRQKLAHNEVEAWNTRSKKWISHPSLVRGRHGSGVFLWEKYLYTCSGSGNRGGSPELTSMERLKIE